MKRKAGPRRYQTPSQREKRVTKPAEKKAGECFGCGFAHAADYKDCVWLKNPY